jgi:hypothetical protein
MNETGGETGMNVAIGIGLIVLCCAFVFLVVKEAGKSVANFDEKKHESFLGK